MLMSVIFQIGTPMSVIKITDMLKSVSAKFYSDQIRSDLKLLQMLTDAQNRLYAQPCRGPPPHMCFKGRVMSGKYEASTFS